MLPISSRFTKSGEVFLRGEFRGYLPTARCEAETGGRETCTEGGKKLRTSSMIEPPGIYFFWGNGRWGLLSKAGGVD